MSGRPLWHFKLHASRGRRDVFTSDTCLAIREGVSLINDVVFVIVVVAVVGTGFRGDSFVIVSVIVSVGMIKVTVAFIMIFVS